jgi:hypothetical protein
MWCWKSNTGDDESGEKDMWAVFEGPVVINNTMQQSGPILKKREHFISRIYPRAVWGELLDFKYDVFDQSFVMHASADAAGSTLIYIPPIVSGSLQIVVSGNAKQGDLVVNPDGSRLVTIDVTAGGTYQVVIAPQGTVHPPVEVKGKRRKPFLSSFHL